MVKVEYNEFSEGTAWSLGVDKGRVAIVSGLRPNEPVFVFRARDRAFPAAFTAWWAEVAEGMSLKRRQQAKASANELTMWAEQNPEMVHLPD